MIFKKAVTAIFCGSAGCNQGLFIILLPLRKFFQSLFSDTVNDPVFLKQTIQLRCGKTAV